MGKGLLPNRRALKIQHSCKCVFVHIFTFSIFTTCNNWDNVENCLAAPPPPLAESGFLRELEVNWWHLPRWPVVWWPLQNAPWRDQKHFLQAWWTGYNEKTVCGRVSLQRHRRQNLHGQADRGVREAEWVLTDEGCWQPPSQGDMGSGKSKPTEPSRPCILSTHTDGPWCPLYPASLSLSWSPRPWRRKE